MELLDEFLDVLERTISPLGGCDPRDLRSYTAERGARAWRTHHRSETECVRSPSPSGRRSVPGSWRTPRRRSARTAVSLGAGAVGRTFRRVVVAGSAAR